MLIHIIDDDQIFVSILKRYLKGHEVRTFSNAIDAINALEKKIPDLIFLDILLDGPDGFTYLDEIASYSDTNSIPTVLISSLYHELPKLKDYNVIAYLDKTRLTPSDILQVVRGVTQFGGTPTCAHAGAHVGEELRQDPEDGL